MQLRAAPHGALSGTANVPGDKSISHRSLLFAALAEGTSKVTGLLEGEDVLSTAGALRQLGVYVERQADGSWEVRSGGAAMLAEPTGFLDLGNAGTGCRLMLGALAGRPFTSFLTGDPSLRARPMARVAEPLSQMGATFATRSRCRLPLAVTGRERLKAITWRSPVASAQVKSAILLAGLAAQGVTTVVEPLASRDHTERMLAGMGAHITSEPHADGSLTVRIESGGSLAPGIVAVPSDPSSAAFPIVAAAISEGSRVRLPAVCMNPLRTGLLTTLREMGAGIEAIDLREEGGEPVADLIVTGSRLTGVVVPAGRAPTMIDEYPVLAVAAAVAQGRTVMNGLAELRVKESDRLTGMANGLAACGVQVDVDGDTLIVTGGPAPRGGTLIDAHLDHRIAMSFLVLGGIAREPVMVDGAETIETSFPGFVRIMNDLGTSIVDSGTADIRGAA